MASVLHYAPNVSHLKVYLAGYEGLQNRAALGSRCVERQCIPPNASELRRKMAFCYPLRLRGKRAFKHQARSGQFGG